MGNFWVVLVDSNPDSPNVKAFFRTQAEAVTWRDVNAPGSGVFNCQINNYVFLEATTIPLE